MKRILLAFAFSLCALPPAVSATEKAQTDPSALIDTIEQRVGLRQRTAGSFTQEKFIAVLPQPLQSHGHFSYDPKSGLVWETLAPIANKVTFDQQGIRQSVEGETVWEIGAKQPAVTTITQVISSVLAADWQSLQAYFAINGSLGSNGWMLRLEPRDEVLAQIVKTIVLQGDRELSRMTLMEANGDRTEIRFQMHDVAQP
jgi:hypothetical protein